MEYFFAALVVLLFTGSLTALVLAPSFVAKVPALTAASPKPMALPIGRGVQALVMTKNPIFVPEVGMTARYSVRGRYGKRRVATIVAIRRDMARLRHACGAEFSKPLRVLRVA